MKPPRILSIGEAMLELSSAGQGDLWRLGIAGDTLNTAWYLHRLLRDEARVEYFTRVGTGEFSQKMLIFWPPRASAPITSPAIPRARSGFTPSR